MATNPYFSHYPSRTRLDNEFLTMEDLIIESIQMMGCNCYYIPRESFEDADMILGEFSRSKFEKYYMIEAYVNEVNKFGGDSDFFSKFGLEIRDTNNFVLARKTFSKIIPTTVRTRPREGDLLYVPPFHRLFEVKFVEEETEMFSLGKTNPFTYALRCELFRYSNENINTGQSEIDQVAMDNQYTLKLNLNNGTGNFYYNETVYQSSNGNINGAAATGTVKDWDSTTSELTIFNIIGNFTATMNVIGDISNTRYNLSSYNDKEDNQDYDARDNYELYTGANTIIDITERNPFGEA